MTKIQKDIFAVSIFFLFWFGLFFYSGTFTSGYHFIDDQDIISLNAKINNTSFLYTAKNYITFDLNWRFRPFWSLHRVAEIKLFGTNFKMFGIPHAGQSCFCNLVSACWFRKHRNAVSESVIVSNGKKHLFGKEKIILWNWIRNIFGCDVALQRKFYNNSAGYTFHVCLDIFG